MSDIRYDVKITYFINAKNVDTALSAFYTDATLERIDGELFLENDDSLEFDINLDKSFRSHLPNINYDQLKDEIEDAHLMNVDDNRDNLNEYRIVFSNTTYGSSPEEAIGISLGCIYSRNGGYFDIFENDNLRIEGEVPIISPKSSNALGLSLVFEPGENGLTVDSSTRLKAAFNEYFLEKGLPESVGIFEDSHLTDFAKVYVLEYSEAVENFEKAHSIKI